MREKPQGPGRVDAPERPCVVWVVVEDTHVGPHRPRGEAFQSPGTWRHQDRDPVEALPHVGSGTHGDEALRAEGDFLSSDSDDRGPLLAETDVDECLMD